MNQQCSKCIWSGQCYSVSACADYYPASDEESNETEAEMTDRDREVFSECWQRMVRVRRETA